MPTGEGQHIVMHRVIMNAPDDMVVDHIDGNGLNNRKSNLRICTKAQNNYNSRPRGGTSQYVGVMYHKRDRKYQAAIGFHGHTIHIGEFDDPVAAAKARDRKAMELQGEFAYLNFPELRETAKRIVSLAGRITLCSRAVGKLSRHRTTAA